VAQLLGIAGLVDVAAWILAEIWFNHYCWYSSCPSETVGITLTILMATGPLLLLVSAVVAVVSYDAYSNQVAPISHRAAWNPARLMSLYPQTAGESKRLGTPAPYYKESLNFCSATSVPSD
jgi:hypothetical protein